MSQRGWDPNKKVISGRRGSDADYDIRSPQSSHVGVRPDPSYYGPNFLNSEQGRSSSFTYGDLKEPTMPDPYVKRPQPYPPEIERQYESYKAHELEVKAANAALRTANPTSVGRNTPNPLPRLIKGDKLATDAILASNSFAAARSGFDHKFPTAYDSLKKKNSHQVSARDLITTSVNARKTRNEIRDKIERFTPGR
ncbi:hypothetical protein ASPCADRAFT_207795 [Aspergillus carbonarius ITEM 5010]|uniref:Uncharacterized protein n=1 Tax=Aspergillus carbonarius (strain ITEM 5010) TaxID=602072 RepID=A0A1R3RLF7_ASPC5|nr:hypothetical protein ASPCADRAFT_207795 [Aspergillus carbonarius ITEM 5010]